MNSKERVLATLDGVIPDRVPLGEFPVDFDTVERIIGRETYLRAKTVGHACSVTTKGAVTFLT
jgi:hypothetical protein